MTLRTPAAIRRLIASALLAWLSATAVAGSAPAAPWYQNALTGMEVGPTGAQWGQSDPKDTRYCPNFDGREIVRRAAEAHAEYVVMWGRDGDFAYYDSKVLPKAPGLGKRDALREAVEEARARHLPIIVYCAVQQDGHLLQSRPDWAMRTPDGQLLDRYCYNSGYLETMKAILAELLAYGVAGVHLDMLDQGLDPPYGCWCEKCQALFFKEFGHPMPPGLTWDAAWDDMLEFRYRSSERFEKALAAHIKALAPQVSVDFNCLGNPPYSWEIGQRPVQHGTNGDFITGETGDWGFSPLTTGLTVEFYRAAVPGQRVQVAMQRGVRMYHDQTTRPLNDLRHELLTLLAHGAFVTMVDKTTFDGALDPVAYTRIGEVFREAQAKRAHFGQQQLAEVGIYFSSRTRDWAGREQPVLWFRSFLGAHRALVYEHIPFGVVLDENATLETLARFPVLILGNAAILSAQEIALFHRYVENGGHLIVCGKSGQFDRLAQPLPDTALTDLIGARLKGRLISADNWVRLGKAENGSAGGPTTSGNSTDPARSVVEGIKELREMLGNEILKPNNAPDDWVFLVEGPASVYDPITARAMGELLMPHRMSRPPLDGRGKDWPMSADAPIGPAILLNQFGKGTVLTFAGSPDYATGSDHAIVEARKLLRGAIRFLNPKPRLEISAPANVETVITDDPTERVLRVHLLAYNAPAQTISMKYRPRLMSAMMEDAPIFRVTVTSREPLKSARALNGSTKLARDGNTVRATVEDVHEVLLLGY
jgi:hypothetical protein